MQFLQAALGYSALRAAAGLLPMAVVMMPLSTVAPTIAERVGFRRTLVVGMGLLTIGLVLLGTMADVPSGYWSVVPGLLVIAAGVGLAMSPSTAAITSSLPEEKQGVASSLNDTVREMGGAVGIALIGSVLNGAYRSNVEPVAGARPPELAEAVRGGIGQALAVGAQLDAGGAALTESARQAFVDGMTPALLLAGALTGAAAVCTAPRSPRVPPPKPSQDSTSTTGRQAGRTSTRGPRGLGAVNGRPVREEPGPSRGRHHGLADRTAPWMARVCRCSRAAPQDASAPGPADQSARRGLALLGRPSLGTPVLVEGVLVSRPVPFDRPLAAPRPLIVFLAPGADFWPVPDRWIAASLLPR